MKYEVGGKVVLITGGSRGLGLVMARQLVAAGARVAICARDPDELRRAKADLGGRVTTITCDVTEPDQLDRLVGEVHAQLGAIDVLINNAGIIQVGPMKLMTLEDYERAMATHFWAPLRLTLAVLPAGATTAAIWCSYSSSRARICDRLSPWRCSPNVRTRAQSAASSAAVVASGVDGTDTTNCRAIAAVRKASRFTPAFRDVRGSGAARPPPRG